jgi:hypothetical protein
VEQLGGRTTAIGVELLRERVGVVENEHKKLGKNVARLEQLGGVVATTNHEQCFLVMLTLKDLQ